MSETMHLYQCRCGQTLCPLPKQWYRCCWLNDKMLEKTTLLYESGALAKKAWEDGYRPIYAVNIIPNDLVMYNDTLFGFALDGEIKTSIVLNIEITPDNVRIYHTGGPPAEEDPMTECWVKREAWPQS